MNVIATAINAAKSDKAEDVRKAIVAIKGWKGVEGTYNFDDNGDGLRGYNIVKNEAGKVKFVEHIDFAK
jgi:branched-chain amino acid transport system substrate-binding protein